MIETAAYSPDVPTSAGCRDFFAEIFASLDERPRPLAVTLAVPGLTIDIVDGEPVFSMPGCDPVVAGFRRRWLPEHPVPLGSRLSGKLKLTLVPASANRVKVRVRGLMRRLFLI